MSGNKYVLDSNVFIQAKNTYYGFDLCPGFWTGLLRKHGEKQVCSIDRVKSEIFHPSSEQNHPSDDLTLWVRDDVPATFFKETVNTFEMLEDLKVKFILNTKKRRG